MNKDNPEIVNNVHGNLVPSSSGGAAPTPTENCRVSARGINRASAKRPKRDFSPLLSPHRKHAKSESKTDPPADETGTLTSNNDPKAKKSKSLEYWSLEEQRFFFDALSECGKNFDGIWQNFALRLRKKGLSEAEIRNKDQVRNFYYRTWHKIAKYVPQHPDQKKRDRELIGLIYYGALRRKMEIDKLDHKHGAKLTEFIQYGHVSVKYMGKWIRIKTPVSPALHKLKKAKDETGHWSGLVKVYLTPQSENAWLRVQEASHNPRICISCLASQKFSALIELLQKKWQKPTARVLSALSIPSHVVEAKLVLFPHVALNAAVDSSKMVDAASISIPVPIESADSLDSSDSLDDGEKHDDVPPINEIPTKEDGVPQNTQCLFDEITGLEQIEIAKNGSHMTSSGEKPPEAADGQVEVELAESQKSEEEKLSVEIAKSVTWEQFEAGLTLDHVGEATVYELMALCKSQRATGLRLLYDFLPRKEDLREANSLVVAALRSLARQQLEESFASKQQKHTQSLKVQMNVAPALQPSDMGLVQRPVKELESGGDTPPNNSQAKRGGKSTLFRSPNSNTRPPPRRSIAAEMVTSFIPYRGRGRGRTGTVNRTPIAVQRELLPTNAVTQFQIPVVSIMPATIGLVEKNATAGVNNLGTGVIESSKDGAAIIQFTTPQTGVTGLLTIAGESSVRMGPPFSSQNMLTPPSSNEALTILVPQNETRPSELAWGEMNDISLGSLLDLSSPTKTRQSILRTPPPCNENSLPGAPFALLDNSRDSLGLPGVGSLDRSQWGRHSLQMTTQIDKTVHDMIHQSSIDFSSKFVDLAKELQTDDDA